MALVLASVVSAVSLTAQQPRLVVGIVVDGLTGETLEKLRPFMDRNGFNRFFNHGAVLDNIDFGTNVNAATASAILATGAAPKVNGIGGDMLYDPITHRREYIFADREENGINTKEPFSPRALRVSTLSDESRIAGAGTTSVHSIAPDATQALIWGGHAGNSAVWLDTYTGTWASTSFYPEFPIPANNANKNYPLSARIDTMQWVPSEVTVSASGLPTRLTDSSFKYTFGGNSADKYDKFANSPFVNSEITRLALDYLATLELGRHEGFDILNLTYNLQPYEWSQNVDNRYELYDSYIKLDNDLAQLFTTIDNTIGRDNTLIYIAGTPPRDSRRRDDGRYNIPGGEFSSRKAVSLLNLYLIALYGNGEWVTAFNNGNFYLNAILANERNIEVSTLRRQTADFLVRMAGIGHAYTIDDIVRGDIIVPNASGQARNTIISQSGDVFINLIPGWTLVDDYNFIDHIPQNAYSVAPTTAMFMITAPDIEPKRIDTPVDARAIAPTLAGMLHIRSPNGADTPSVSLK